MMRFSLQNVLEMVADWTLGERQMLRDKVMQASNGKQKVYMILHML